LRTSVRGSIKTDCGANVDAVQIEFALPDNIDFVFVRQSSHEFKKKSGNKHVVPATSLIFLNLVGSPTIMSSANNTFDTP